MSNKFYGENNKSFYTAVSSLEAAVKRGPTINGMYISTDTFKWDESVAASGKHYGACRSTLFVDFYD